MEHRVHRTVTLASFGDQLLQNDEIAVLTSPGKISLQKAYHSCFKRAPKKSVLLEDIPARDYCHVLVADITLPTYGTLVS